MELKNQKAAIPLVLLAGLLWSFGPYVVRNIDAASTVPWQYLFTRGLVIFILLNFFLFLEEGKNFYKNYLKKRWKYFTGINFKKLQLSKIKIKSFYFVFLFYYSV